MGTARQLDSEILRAQGAAEADDGARDAVRGKLTPCLNGTSRSNIRARYTD